MICEKHRKFAAYWEEIGKPNLESRTLNTDKWHGNIYDPYWYDEKDYRIIGDKHFELRRKWINSDKTLPIEFKDIDGSWVEAYPNWIRDTEYREVKAERTEVKMIEDQIKELSDPGKHYRHEYTVKLTPEDIERGSVTIKLDPARIADICGMTNHMAFFLLKKSMRLGTSIKDMRQEFIDCRDACRRALEMMDEDEFNGR